MHIVEMFSIYEQIVTILFLAKEGNFLALSKT